MYQSSSKPLILAVACLISVVATADAVAQNPEVRGLWVTRFEWPDSDPVRCRGTIDEIMTTLQDAHFNAVFFQVRGQADVLYPSPEEVWSSLIGGQDPGWDPLAYAIEAAHAHGLEFHAYINTHTCYQTNSTFDPPANPNHLFYQHCNANDANAQDWLIHDIEGDPVQYDVEKYVWLAPGVPAFQSYLRRQVLYVVRNYDVDGVHFDRIRTVDSQYSYDPISMARLADPRTNPYGLDFHAWTTDQITRTVRDIYAEIMAVKPWVKVSAAVYPDPDWASVSEHQDAAAWMAAGALDMAVPMVYTSGGAGSYWDYLLQLWLARSAGRHVVMGQHVKIGFEELYAQIELVRMRGGAGTNLFSWSKLYPTLLDQYRTIAYPTVVATPAMPWKASPSTGIVQGFVENAVGDRVVDAQVRYSDTSYIALSSGDGYYAHLLVPAGTFTLTASHPDYDPASVGGVTVAPGDVRRVDITFTQVRVPKTRLVAEPTQAIIEESVTLTARVALPAGDSITAWTLDFGDGDEMTGAGLPAAVDHVYPEIGSYQPSFSMTTALHGTIQAEPLTITIVPKPPIPGDFDGDRDVDQEDFGSLQRCLTGSAAPQTAPQCAPGRLDSDEDVDTNDVMIFIRCLTGPGRVGDPACDAG